MVQKADPAMESVYQKRLEEARELEKNGQYEEAGKAYDALAADYPDKFGAWWAHARLYMECQLDKEPCPPYPEIELESVMLKKALGIADNSQKLFIKQRIAEYKEAWILKCDESRQKTRNALREFWNFEGFVKNFHGTYEAASGEGKITYRLLRQGKKTLCFQKVIMQDKGKTDIMKYTYNNWSEQNYRLEGVYNEAADFELYVKDFDEQKVVLAYVFSDEKEQRHILIELDKK